MRRAGGRGRVLRLSRGRLRDAFENRLSSAIVSTTGPEAEGDRPRIHGNGDASNESIEAKIYGNADVVRSDKSIQTALDLLKHTPGETVVETTEFPSTLRERVVLEKPEDVPTDEFIERLVGLTLGEIDRRHLDMEVQADVELARE